MLVHICGLTLHLQNPFSDISSISYSSRGLCCPARKIHIPLPWRWLHNILFPAKPLLSSNMTVLLIQPLVYEVVLYTQSCGIRLEGMWGMSMVWLQTSDFHCVWPNTGQISPIERDSSLRFKAIEQHRGMISWYFCFVFRFLAALSPHRACWTSSK